MRSFTTFKSAFLFFLALLSINLEANPVLARQYGMDCSACHSQAPALNDMGLSFIRNGLRTSTYDTTALKSFLDENSSNRHYPVGAMIGLSDNSYSDEVNRLVKLYLSGTLTESLSLMALSKESFKSSKSDQELFESYNSQLYLQYNIAEAKQVIRAGLLSPLTQLGNVKRSMAHSGLHGGIGHGNTYLSPLDHANVKKIKGVEYSYLFDNNVLVLVSYGTTVNKSMNGHSYFNEYGNLVEIDNSNEHDNSNEYENSCEHDNSCDDDNVDGHDSTNESDNSYEHDSSYEHDNSYEHDYSYDKTNLNKHQKLLLYGDRVNRSKNAFLAAIKYTTAENYKIGLIYNYVDMENDDYYSMILPVEKEYGLFIWNSSLVYANYSDEDYLGLESAFTFPVGDMAHIKAIVNVDRDIEDNTNFGYSLGFTKIYKMFFFEAVASRVNTETYSSSRMKGSVNLIF